MLTQADEKRFVGDILRASFEAMTLNDLGRQILPLIEGVFDTSGSILYRRDEGGQISPFAGTLAEALPEYVPYYSEDPMQDGFGRSSPWIKPASALPEWKKYLFSGAYADWFRPYRVHDFLHVRLTATTHQEPGMVGVFLGRSARQPHYGEREIRIAERVLPPLEALVRRSARLEETNRVQAIAEAVLDQGRRPVIALSTNGVLLWASKRAEDLAGITRGNRRRVPDVLVSGARRLGRLVGKNAPSVPPPSAVALPRKDGAPVRAELRLARTPIGAYFVIAEIEDFEFSPFLTEVAARFRLTAAETQVLGRLSLGLSDREIGRRLFVSLATVHTHVVRVLDKLGVHSRVQAALMAHGLRAETASIDETSPSDAKGEGKE